MKLRKVREDLDFWARIDGATTAAKQEALVKEFLGDIERQCFKVIRDKGRGLEEAKKTNEEMMKYVYMIVEKARFNSDLVARDPLPSVVPNNAYD